LAPREVTVNIARKTDADDDSEDMPATARDVAMAIKISSSQWNEEIIDRLVKLLGGSTTDDSWQKVRR